MSFRLWFESLDYVAKQRVLAPIGSEHLEHYAKVTPIQIEFNPPGRQPFHETWYITFTQWQPSHLDRTGGGVRILVTCVPDSSDFEGGLVCGYEGDSLVIIAYYMDQHSKMSDPYLAKAAKSIGVRYIHSHSSPTELAFAQKYGFEVMKVV